MTTRWLTSPCGQFGTTEPVHIGEGYASAASTTPATATRGARRTNTVGSGRNRGIRGSRRSIARSTASAASAVYSSTVGTPNLLAGSRMSHMPGTWSYSHRLTQPNWADRRPVDRNNNTSAVPATNKAPRRRRRPARPIPARTTPVNARIGSAQPNDERSPELSALAYGNRFHNHRARNVTTFATVSRWWVHAQSRTSVSAENAVPAGKKSWWAKG